MRSRTTREEFRLLRQNKICTFPHLEDVEWVEDLFDDEQRDGDDGDDDGVGAEQPPPPPLFAIADSVGEAVKGGHGHLRVEATQRVEDGFVLVPDVGQLLATEVSETWDSPMALCPSF